MTGGPIVAAASHRPIVLGLISTLNEDGSVTEHAVKDDDGHWLGPYAWEVCGVCMERVRLAGDIDFSEAVWPCAESRRQNGEIA